jgi:hypothetical protein
MDVDYHGTVVIRKLPTGEVEVSDIVQGAGAVSGERGRDLQLGLTDQSAAAVRHVC